MKTIDGEKVPKVYTTYPKAWDAMKDAGLVEGGLSGGFTVIKTDDGAVKFNVPFNRNATTTMCYAGAFLAGIKYAQHLAAQDVLRRYWGDEQIEQRVTEVQSDPWQVALLDPHPIDGKQNVNDIETHRTGGRRSEGIQKERNMTTDTLIRISTHQSEFFYAIDTDAEALDAFGVEAGYKSYADLASVEGKTVEQSLADITINRVTYRDAAWDIVSETLAADTDEDGAEGPFASTQDWVDWCMQGKTGNDVRQFARGHRLDVNLVRAAVIEALLERDLTDINAPFVERFDEDDLMAAVAEVDAGLDGVDDMARSEWSKETALEDAHAYVDAYICHEEGNQYAEAAADGTAFREALDNLVRHIILAAIAEREAA